MSIYKSTVIETVHYVEIPLVVSKTEAEEFKKDTKKWLSLTVDLHVFDFKNVEKLTSQFYDHFLKFKKEAQGKNAKVISINFKQRLLEKLKEDGQDSQFGYVSSLDSLQTSKSKDNQIEVRNWLARYMVAASRLAMNTMFNTTVAADENYRENSKDFKPEEYYRIAMVAADSRLVKAHFRLYFDKETLVQLTRITVKRAPIDDELIDSTATELLNLIYGGAKSNLNNDRGYDLPTAIPILISPLTAAKQRSTDTKNIYLIPFVTPVGSYFLEIDFSA